MAINPEEGFGPAEMLAYKDGDKLYLGMFAGWYDDHNIIIDPLEDLRPLDERENPFLMGVDDLYRLHNLEPELREVMRAYNEHQKGGVQIRIIAEPFNTVIPAFGGEEAPPVMGPVVDPILEEFIGGLCGSARNEPGA